MISPETTTRPVLTSVSHATRRAGPRQAGVEHAVGDLVGDLVGVTFGHGLGGEQEGVVLAHGIVRERVRRSDGRPAPEVCRPMARTRARSSRTPAAHPPARCRCPRPVAGADWGRGRLAPRPAAGVSGHGAERGAVRQATASLARGGALRRAGREHEHVAVERPRRASRRRAASTRAGPPRSASRERVARRGARRAARAGPRARASRVRAARRVADARQQRHARAAAPGLTTNADSRPSRDEPLQRAVARCEQLVERRRRARRREQQRAAAARRRGRPAAT